MQIFWFFQKIGPHLNQPLLVEAEHQAAAALLTSYTFGAKGFNSSYSQPASKAASSIMTGDHQTSSKTNIIRTKRLREDEASNILRLTGFKN